MTRPSSGVSPMEVSTLRPPSMAVALAPLPRCSTMRFVSSGARPSSSAARRDTYAHDVPWKPNRRTPHSPGTAYVYASGGSVRWKAVSNTATCGTPGKASRATRTPARFTGLCSGASGASSSMAAITPSSTSTASRKRVPPCTTRCPTATGSSSGPAFSNASRTAASASACPGNARSHVYGRPRPSPAWWVSRPSSSPTRSTRPRAARSRDPTSISSYLMEEEPVFRTRIRAAMSTR